MFSKSNLSGRCWHSAPRWNPSPISLSPAALPTTHTSPARFESGTELRQACFGRADQTTHIFSDTELLGASGQYLREDGGYCAFDHMSIMAMPPGIVDLDFKLSANAINLVPFRPAKFSHFELNGETRSLEVEHRHGLNYYAAGSDFYQQCVNNDWECLIEFSTDNLLAICAEQAENTNVAELEIAGAIDQTAGVLAQLVVNHLRQPTIDKLYIEGLASALMSRTVKLIASDSKLPSTVGTDRRIDRAIDYINTHLLDTLTVSDMASVACMSPSWFSRVFKERTGLSVHAYVLEKRLERAMMALSTTKDPIANIGFADHSHLTRTFRKRYGATPSALRAG